MQRLERLDADVVVVGAGFAGSILAERLAASSGQRVIIIDKRDHIAGNAYDYVDEHGVLVHKYGPHIFHTNAEKVVDYLSRFTDWRPYEHRVRAWVDGQLVPIPINRTTVNELYGLNLQTEEEVAAFYAERAEPIDYVRTSEDAVVSKVGRDLYEKFFRGYTRKQWKRDPSELHASVASRIPTRTNSDDRYFTDTFQKMPAEGFTAMFARMLDHPLIDVRVSTDFFDVREQLKLRHVVFTGPVDLYFDRCYGELPYRSLEFSLRTEPTPGGGLVQPVGTDQRAERRRALHADDGTAARHGPAAGALDADRGVPARRRRPVLPHPERRDQSLVQALRGLGRRRGRRHVRRAAGPLPVPEHGPGDRAGAQHLRQAGRAS